MKQGDMVVSYHVAEKQGGVIPNLIDDEECHAIKETDMVMPCHVVEKLWNRSKSQRLWMV